MVLRGRGKHRGLVVCFFVLFFESLEVNPKGALEPFSCLVMRGTAVLCVPATVCHPTHCAHRWWCPVTTCSAHTERAFSCRAGRRLVSSQLAGVSATSPLPLVLESVR